MTVTLVPSVEPPAPVGTVVTWGTLVEGADPGTIWYRFRSHRIGDAFRTIRDYGPEESLDWAAGDFEGSYEVEVSVRNRDTGETVTVSVPFQITSRADNGPVVSPTAHPLVFLYSAPPCPTESRMRVAFQSPEGWLQTTPYKTCRPGLSMNFYIGGLRPETTYIAYHIVDNGSAFMYGPMRMFTTGDIAAAGPDHSVVHAPQVPMGHGVLLESNLFTQTVAADLNGNIIWYYPGTISMLTRADSGGRFFGLVQVRAAQSRQVVREFDLAGITVAETNAARVNEQLAAMGKRQIGSFHHEARRLPDGRILVLGSVEQILTDVQGPGDIDVLGDMIIILDQDLQVVWTWDTFDHLDVTRKAVLGETCTLGGCPPLYLANNANDWTHANSVQQTGDGNLVLSSRHQDWVIKINYNNGAGNGDVMWRLGKDGDFSYDSSSPFPWFSHQHDAQIDSDSLMTVFDDGNTRRFSDENANSRGQVIRLDEQNRTAHLVLNADLDAYSFALGSAQRLANGNYHFDVGWIEPANASLAVEVSPAGQVVYALQTSTPNYRSFRMRDLYTPVP